MPFVGEWCKVWIYFGFVFAWTKGARPRFDTSTDMGLVLVPADAEVDSVIFRLRATDQDADFPLVFEITATITPVVRIDNLPCTLYNKVCQANVILTKRLVPGRLHDFAVRVRDTKGDSNSMQATISVTNATTPRDKIFPHIPSLIMVPEDTKPGKELDYLLVRANSWSGKPVYIELWQPKELFTIRQRQTPVQTRGVITLIGELDFETQSMYTLTMYATDPYTEPRKDTRNIAGLSLVVVVQDVQDVPPIFTLAPPLTRINNSVQPGDIILRVHAEDGDKGVPREIVYGLVSESNPFTPFFNISETSGEITLARPLEELTQITHVGAPVVLTVVAEEIRRSKEEPPAQATVVDVGFLLGEPGNSPPYFESDNYIAMIDENLEPGTMINFGEQYSTRVKDEDIGKAGVFALKLENNNGTFEINPTVAERTADFIIIVRDNTLIDYELYKILSFKIIAQEVGPATNLSASVPVTIFLRDINDNPPVFEEELYEVTLSENVTAGSRVVQVHATDKDTGVYGSIRYTSIIGEGSEAFTMDPDTGLITVAMGSSLDREIAAKLELSVEARDENGNGNRGVVPLIVNLLDVNDNMPIFEKEIYEFTLNANLTNFTSSAFIKAIDADAEPPNNLVRYELVHGNYENKFYLNETSGELILRSPLTKIRRKKQSAHDKLSRNVGKELVRNLDKLQGDVLKASIHINENESSTNIRNKMNSNFTEDIITEVVKKRRKRDNEDALYTLTARAYDLGVPHLSSVTQIRILNGIAMEARIMMFVVPGEHPDSIKTAETLAAITGGRVTVLETRPYVQQNHTQNASTPSGGGKKSIIVARVEQTEPGTPLVDVEKIREALAANGVGIIGGTETFTNTTININNMKPPVDGTSRNSNNNMQTAIINNTITSIQSEEVTVYKAENKLLMWLLIILGLLMLLAIAALIICCICPGCPFYMAPRKRRVHSSETLVVRADGRPKRHLHRQPAAAADVSWNGRKQAWSADPTRRNWQFNKRNTKNCSLPGDVAYISGHPTDIQMNVEALRLRDGPLHGHSRRSRMDEQERLYMEDVEGQKTRGYDTTELDSLQRHEMERGSDVQRHAYRQRYVEPDMNEETTVREQHFYRDGNAEVLRLVTRGQVEDATSHPHQSHHHHPTTLIVDGKDIILQRFIEDQKSRHEISMQDIEAARSMESHQRPKDVCQQQPEIILIPDRLEVGHRQHVEEIGPNVQRLVIDHGDYGSQKMEKESQIMREDIGAGISLPDRSTAITKEHVQTSNARYSFHDLELARQNALLTRLLLERESRRPAAGAVDSTSYLETQSLPGQVAIATQTDRTTATQTERQARSRSDNEESDEEARHRKKLKSRKKYGDGDWKRSRALWMKSPIQEEGSPCFDKRLSILRKKVREVKEGRKIPLEPEVLREISDSLDGNGSSCKGEEDESMRTYRKSMEKTSISYKVLNEKQDGSQSSEETRKDKRQKISENVIYDQKMNTTESASSPEIKIQREKYDREKAEEKSPKKEAKSKARKSDGVIKPSFRILEKEFTLLTKKLSKLGEKKFHESSDSTSQEKSEAFPKETKKESEQRSSRKSDATSSQRQTIEITTPSGSKTDQKAKQKKEATAKTKQKLKYQQSQLMSTGSSEYDDALDKPRKASTRQEILKQRQPAGSQVHAKVKRQAQADRRELKKQMAEFREEEIDKRKDGPRETPKIESKAEKVGKTATRAPKLAAISRKDHVTEEMHTSAEDAKDAFSFPDSEKKSSTDLSERDSSEANKEDEKSSPWKVIQKFSDDFVEKLDTEETGQRDTTEVEEKVDAKGKKREEKADNEKQLSAVSKIQTAKTELEEAKVSDKELKKSEGESSAKKKLADDFATYMEDKKKQLIRDHVVSDNTKSREKKSIEAKVPEKGEKTKKELTLQAESITEERLKRQEKDIEDITKQRLMGDHAISDTTRTKEKKLIEVKDAEKDKKKDKELTPQVESITVEKLRKQKEDIESTTKQQLMGDHAISDISQMKEKKIETKDAEKDKKIEKERAPAAAPATIEELRKQKEGIESIMKERLMEDHAISDTTRTKEKQLIEVENTEKDKKTEKEFAPQVESITVEESKEHKGELSITKQSEKDRVAEEKAPKVPTSEKEHRNIIASEVEKDISQAPQDKLDDHDERHKLLDDTKTLINEAENIMKERKQESKESDNGRRDLKQKEEMSSEDPKKQDLSLGEREHIAVEQKFEQMPSERNEIPALSSEAIKDAETKRDIEDKSYNIRSVTISDSITEKKEMELDIKTKEDVQDAGKRDLMQKIEEITEKHEKSELPSGDNKKQDVTDKLGKFEKKDEEKKSEKESEPLKSEKDKLQQIDEIEEKKVEHVGDTKEVKEVSQIAINEYEKKEMLDVDIAQISHKGEVISDIKTDQQSEENVFLDKEKIPDKKEESVAGIKIDTPRIIENVSLGDDRKINDEKEMIQSTIKDDKISEEGNIFFDKGKASEKKEEASMKTTADEIAKEEISFREKKNVSDKTETETKIDKHQISGKETVFSNGEEKITDFPTDEQGNGKGIPFDKKETGKEKDIGADRKIDEKENISSGKKIEKDSIEEKETAMKKDAIKDYKIKQQDSTFTNEEKEKPHDQEKENIVAAIMDDHEISKKGLELDISKSSKVEEFVPTAEKKDDVSGIQDHKQDIFSKVTDVNADNINQERESFPKTSTAIEEQEKKMDEHQKTEKDDILVEPSKKSAIEEQKKDMDEHQKTEKNDISIEPSKMSATEEEKKIDEVQKTQKGDISIKPPVFADTSSIQDTLTKMPSIDDQTSKKEGIFSEMFKAVHSLVDNLTSTSTETETMELTLYPDDKLVMETASLLPPDDKSKEASKSDDILDLKAASKSLKQMEEDTSIKWIDEGSDEDKYMASAKDETESKTKDTEKDSTIDIAAKPKEETLEGSKQVELDQIEKEESTETLDDRLASPTETEGEKTKVQRDIANESIQRVSKDSAESKETPDNETVNGKLAQKEEETSKKEEELHVPSMSDSVQKTELLPTSSPEEKFALDSVIPKTSTDSKKIFEPEEQLKPESKQIDIQEVQQSVEEQTSATKRDKIESRSMISEDESNKKDATEENVDQTLPSIRSVAPKTEKDEGIIEAQYVDVSLPLFTSTIDTVDDSDDSDSSSDISRKTTLTTKPYQTPRHRALQSPAKENTQGMEKSDGQDIEDEERMLIMELAEDEDIGVLKDVDMFEEIEDTIKEQLSPTKLIKAVAEEETESYEDYEIPVKVQIPPIKEKITVETDVASTQKGKQVQSKFSSEFIEEPSTSSKRTKDRKLKSDGSSSTTKHAKTEHFKASDKKIDETERKRIPSQRKKKSSSEGSPEEKATHSHDASHARQQPRKKPPDKQSRQKDRDQVKQSRKSDEDQRRRKQSTSKVKREKDKTSCSSSSEKHPSPPKTSEIDTSKTQPKYMAWYKKNREQMEKKRAELMATDDEEQLPRWLRRSMRSQKSGKDKDKEEKRSSSRKTGDTTPRTKRKVKPLVNVESEQLKAIVRQGRKLRRAEGGKNEDPPVQIFATTPPAASRTESKHYLVQHSEYKYEKMPAPFYLHPPPVPHPSPQLSPHLSPRLSPQHFEGQSTMECTHTDEAFNPEIAMALQGGNRLRHQQLLEKKSVFDIAYSEAAPSQLRSDSTTPPS